MSRLTTRRTCAALAAVALVAGPTMLAFAGQAPGNTAPAAQLAAARAKLDAFKSYRERRDYREPTRLDQIVEFSGAVQHWINLDPQGVVVSEHIWEKARSASRKPPETTWRCNPPVPDEYPEPDATVHEGPSQVVNGQDARRFVEELINPAVGSRVVHEVDVSVATGVPIRLTSTETEGALVTRYVGTYYDLGVPIALTFPRCR